MSFKRASNQNYTYKLNSENKILSSLIKQNVRYVPESKSLHQERKWAIAMCPFPTESSRRCCSSFLHRTYLIAENCQVLQNGISTAQKMRFSVKDFFSKCDQIRSFLRIWSDLLKKSLIENLIFCAVQLFPF